jgi:hypothetical protein
MELTEIARGHLRVKDGTKNVTVYGEALLSGYGSPDFVLYQHSIEKWDVPNDKEDITLAKKEQLIHFLKNEFSKRKMLLEID